MARLIIAGTKPWNRTAYDRWQASTSHEHLYISSREELTVEAAGSFRPDYIFFLHWSWMIPAALYDAYRCVVFHMTDLPYGRGGSPLQNLIERGHATTKISAIEVVEALDAGPVYLKREVSLGGSAEDIFVRLTSVCFDLIEEIASTNPAPQPQTGEPVFFRRRTPDQSRIDTAAADLEKLYDFIRMLDADSYPRAFLDYGPYRLEFGRVSHANGALKAEVRITIHRQEQE